MNERGDGGGASTFPETLASTHFSRAMTPMEGLSPPSAGQSDGPTYWPQPNMYYGNQGPAWVGLLVLGIMLIISGIMSIAFFSSDDSSYDPWAQQDSDFDKTTNTMGAIMIIGGFVMILVSFMVKSHETSLVERMARFEPREQEPESERRVVEELIKVRCRYCSTLNDVNAKHCISCGAVL